MINDGHWTRHNINEIDTNDYDDDDDRMVAMTGGIMHRRRAIII